MTAALYFIAGLVLLTFAGDALVRGSIAIAHRFHVPAILVGLTIVSMGTSAPELFVSLQAALGGAADLAVGNAIGSNIANSLIVLGLPALIAPVYFMDSGTRRSVTFMFAISIAIYALAADGLISTFDGLVLVVLFVIYLSYGYTIALSARRASNGSSNDDEEETPQPKSLFKPVSLLASGFVGLAVGAKLTVDGALQLAEILGIGQTVVGTTIVAFGTTLPEISATLAASFRRHAGVAVGNVIGSNIFNLLGILGITALVVPLPVAPRLLSFDLWVMLAAAGLMIPMAFMRRPVGRWIGVVLSLGYVTYLFVAFTS